MLLGFSSLVGSNEESIGSSGSSHDELVEGHAFSSGLDDFSSGGLSESEGGDGHLGEIEDSEIISDGSDDNSDFILSVEELDELLDGDRGSVDSGRNESSQDSLSESGVSSSGEESEKLNKEMQVKVSGSGVLLV